MSTETRKSVEELIDKLHRSAAYNIAMAHRERTEFPWREWISNGAVFEARAQADLAAARHLMEEL